MSQTSQGKVLLVTGRIVWVNGDLFKGEVKKDQNTKMPIIDQRTGLQKVEYGFGLAIPKSQITQVLPPNTEALWNAIYGEALSLYPSGQLPPAFSMKFKDGDGVDHNGKPFAEREGYAGHIVLSLSTSVPIKYFVWDAAMNTNVQVDKGIKCGDYVTVQLGIKAHLAIGQGKPGMYLNPYAVQLAGYGPEIVRAPQADSIFGNMAPVAPQGASQTPVASAQFPMQGVSQPMAPQQPTMPQAPQVPQQPTYPQQAQGIPTMPGIPGMPQVPR